MSTGKKTGGRRVGTPNKATAEARQAIAMFVDENAHRLTEWLDQVAYGVAKDDGDYVIPPNPAKAFDMFQSVVEYHIPKLARQEHVGDANNPISVEHSGSDKFLEIIKNLEMNKRAG